MKILNYFYVFGIIGAIVLDIAFKIDVLWIVGYLLILFVAGLVPKKLKIELIVSAVLLTAAIIAALSGQGSISDMIAAFLLLASGLPGAVLYGTTTILLHSNSVIQSMTLVSESAFFIILLLQVARLVLIKVFFVSFWIPVVDIIPILVDTALIIGMTYLTIGTGNGSVLYLVIQNGVNSLLG